MNRKLFHSSGSSSSSSSQSINNIREFEDNHLLSSKKILSQKDGKDFPEVEIAGSDEYSPSGTTISPTSTSTNHHVDNDNNTTHINLDEVDIDDVPMNPFMFLLAGVASISGFMFGYDTGYISSALVVIGKDLGKELSSGDKEFITAATSLGAFMGGIIAGWLADIFGRKWIVLGANSMFIIGAIIQTACHAVWPMIIGRFIMGWGVGLASLLAPLYISEMAPSRFRGRLVIMNVLAITGGQVVAYAIGAGLSHVYQGWRILVGLSLIPATIQMVIFIFMPDTPRYLVRINRLDLARNVLLLTYQGATEQEIDHKLKILISHNKDIFPDSRGIKRVWLLLKELHCVPSNFRALIIACGLQGLQQFCGFNSLMYFSSTIFETVGFSNPTATSLIIAGTNFVFTCIAFTLIDLIGRRRILLCTVWGMAAGMYICAVAFHYLPPGDASYGNKWSILILISMLVYVAFYTSGIGNVPWQQSELFPMSVRGIGTGISTSVNWAGNLIISSTFLTMLDKMTPTGTFIFFGSLCVIGEIFVYFIYPETAGLPLEGVQSLLSDGFNVRQSELKSREYKALSKLKRGERKAKIDAQQQQQEEEDAVDA